MNRDVRELVQKAEQLGFRYAGVAPGGHIALVHENGQTYYTAASPSDYRGQKNAIAELERIAGRKLPRVNHRRSRKSTDTVDQQVEAARRRAQAKAIERERAREARTEAERIAEAARRASAAASAADDERVREIRRLMGRGA